MSADATSAASMQIREGAFFVQNVSGVQEPDQKFVSAVDLSSLR